MNCLFCKRLGSGLTPKNTRPDGSIPTRTAYKYKDAMPAALTHHDQLPDVPVYRKTAHVTFSAEQLERAQ